MSLFLRHFLIVGLATGLAWVGLAQVFRSDDGSSYARLEGGAWVNEDTVRTARETVSHSVTLPAWTNPAGFENDVFTFARVLFRSHPSITDGGVRGRRLGWWVDYPDADLNLSHRLQQMTSIAVDPDARVIRLTDPELTNYPFLFMVHVEGIMLDDAEVLALRNHFQRGGTLLVTDFWGTDAWEHFQRQIKVVLPEHNWVELTMEHPVFRSIFHIEGPLHMLRIPTMQFWNTRADRSDPQSEVSVRYRGVGSEEMHVFALFDERGRIMAVALHNSDVSDGWERESENEAYFKEFSEPVAYPLALNIIFYLMTH